MAQELTKRVPKLITHQYLLFPFIGLLPEHKAGLLNLAYFADGIPGFSRLIYSSRMYLKGIFPGVQNIRLDEIKVAMRLGYFEKKFFRPSKGLFGHISYPENSTFFYCDEDPWCHQATIEELITKIKSVKVDCKHDFVVNPGQRRVISKLILDKNR